MNRGQFEEDKKDENEDDMGAFFDCKIAEGMDSNEPLAIMSEDAADELKMDKDLGLFEFIQKGDFSTVTNAAGAEKAAAGSSKANDA